MANTSQQRHHLTTVAGPIAVSGNWAQVAGGKGGADTSESWDGGAVTPQVLTGPKKYTDLTVTRPFKRERDAALVRALDATIGKDFTIRRVYTDEDMIATADSTTWRGKLKAVTDPDNDTTSAENATMSLVFGISSRS